MIAHVRLNDHVGALETPEGLPAVLAVLGETCAAISRTVAGGALVGALGASGQVNVQDEEQKKLDIITNDMLREALAACASVFGLASEELDTVEPTGRTGEGGYLGREEIDIIEPALARLRSEGIDVRGPYPADTLFQPFMLQDADAVLAMYHDQGLPVLKFASFGKGVNITLGLPFIRTSVDHGTALDLAGSGRADPGSLKVALETALQMAQAAFPANAQQ